MGAEHRGIDGNEVANSLARAEPQDPSMVLKSSTVSKFIFQGTHALSM